MNNITSAIDFILYQRIDEILWFDWDPLGINDIAPRDEYHSYVIEIFELLKAKADRQTIAEHLYKIETNNMAEDGNIEKCLTIADEILKIE